MRERIAKDMIDEDAEVAQQLPASDTEELRVGAGSHTYFDGGFGDKSGSNDEFDNDNIDNEDSSLRGALETNQTLDNGDCGMLVAKRSYDEIDENHEGVSLNASSVANMNIDFDSCRSNKANPGIHCC